MRKTRIVLFLALLGLFAGCNTSPLQQPAPVPPATNTTPPPVTNVPPPTVNTIPSPTANVTLPPEPPPPAQGPNEVWIQAREFKPSVLTVSPGTTVIWTNKDSEFHTVTSNTGLFGPGLAFTQTFRYTFVSPGTYNYYCDPHPEMTGTIIVR